MEATAGVQARRTNAGNDSVRRADRGTRAVVLLWALLRLPVLAWLAYVLRGPLLNLIERQFDVLSTTRFVIDVLSTPVSRLGAAAGFLAALLVIRILIGRLGPMVTYVSMLVGGGALIALSSGVGAISARRGLLVAVILAVNLVPARFLEPLKQRPHAWNAMMFAGVGAAELLFAREYWQWIRGWGSGQSGGSRSGFAAAVPGLLLASLAFGVLMRGERLLPFEQAIRMPPEVEVVARGLSFNWIELDPAGTHLYVTGHEVPYLRRYDVRNLSAPPLLAKVSTGGAQGFAFDPDANQIYAVNTFTNQLLYFDATTLETTRVVGVPDLSPGDPWVVVDSRTDTLTIVSEADLTTGVPFIVLNRTTGQVFGRADLDAGNVLKHPTQPWLYLTFFRRRSEVVLYDLTTRSVTRTAAADPRAERMAFWKAQNELLVTSPMESRIMRFDADRLTPKGSIPALFGARAIAIDERRQLLLCGNIATGHLLVIDLRTGKRLTRRYLGPWLRTIQLGIDSGIAYVSANGALYAVQYASPLPDSALHIAPTGRRISDDAHRRLPL